MELESQFFAALRSDVTVYEALTETCELGLVFISRLLGTTPTPQIPLTSITSFSAFLHSLEFCLVTLPPLPSSSSSSPIYPLLCHGPIGEQHAVELEVIRNLLYSVIEDMEDRTGTPDDVKKRLIFSALKLEKVRPRTFS